MKDNEHRQISDLILKMLDEDILNPPGTAEKAANRLLKKSCDCGREVQFKDALRFWKNHPHAPEAVLVQWFEGVFRGIPDVRRSQPQPKRRGRRPA